MTSKQELELFGIEDSFLDDIQDEVTGLIVGIATTDREMVKARLDRLRMTLDEMDAKLAATPPKPKVRVSSQQSTSW